MSVMLKKAGGTADPAVLQRENTEAAAAVVCDKQMPAVRTYGKIAGVLAKGRLLTQLFKRAAFCIERIGGNGGGGNAPILLQLVYRIEKALLLIQRQIGGIRLSGGKKLFGRAALAHTPYGDAFTLTLYDLSRTKLERLGIAARDQKRVLHRLNHPFILWARVLKRHI